jgi:hypothetical protein
MTVYVGLVLDLVGAILATSAQKLRTWSQKRFIHAAGIDVQSIAVPPTAAIEQASLTST